MECGCLESAGQRTIRLVKWRSTYDYVEVRFARHCGLCEPLRVSSCLVYLASDQLPLPSLRFQAMLASIRICSSARPLLPIELRKELGRLEKSWLLMSAEVTRQTDLGLEASMDLAFCVLFAIEYMGRVTFRQRRFYSTLHPRRLPDPRVARVSTLFLESRW